MTLGAAPTPPVDINKFRWQADDQGAADSAVKADPKLDTSGPDWHDATTATDAFNGRLGSAWFRTSLPDVPGPHRRIHFNSIDDNGQVFLNGKQIASNVGVNAGADVSLDSAWREGGPNVLAVSVQNTAGGGGMNGTVTLQGDLVGSRDLHGWRMRGGVRLPADAAWRPLPKTLPAGRRRPLLPHDVHLRARAAERPPPHPAGPARRPVARLRLAQRAQPGPLPGAVGRGRPVPAGVLDEARAGTRWSSLTRMGCRPRRRR